MLFYARSSPCYCVFLHSFRSVLVRNCHAKEIFLDHHCQSSLFSRLIEWVIGVIYKSSFCLPVTSLRSLFYNLVWASKYPTNLNRIVLRQKKKKFELFPRRHLMLTLILNSNVCKYWNYLKFTFFKLESSCILIK